MIKTHHIQANRKEISDKVIMVGDPNRAHKIANDYLEDAKLVCNIRSIQIWTGTYKGNKVTVMGHGMGMSSIAIYAHELFEYFDVERIIRVGSSGGYHDLSVGDVVIGNAYYTHSKFGQGYDADEDVVIPNEEFIKTIEESAKDINKNTITGGIYCSEWFYAPSFYGEGVKEGSLIEEKIKSKEIIAKEMESYALTMIGNYFKKETATIVTVIENMKNHQPGIKVDTSSAGEIALEALIR